MTMLALHETPAVLNWFQLFMAVFAPCLAVVALVGAGVLWRGLVQVRKQRALMHARLSDLLRIVGTDEVSGEILDATHLQVGKDHYGSSGWLTLSHNGVTVVGPTLRNLLVRYTNQRRLALRLEQEHEELLAGTINYPSFLEDHPNAQS